MHLWSLWTPLLWGRGSFVSCTMCTFTLNLQQQQPQCSTREAAYGDPRSMGMSFLGLAETEEQPKEKRLQFRVSVMDKPLQLRHRHQHILEYSSIRNGPELSTLPLCLSNGSQYCNGEVSPISSYSHGEASPILTLTPILDYSSIRNGTCCDQHFHIVCRVEVTIATEKRLQFWYRHRLTFAYTRTHSTTRASATV